MTVAQTNAVDSVGIDKGTGHVHLSLVDDLDWSDEQGHLRVLQGKLNTYIAFIESGEVFAQLTERLGRRVPRTTPVTVTILASFALTPEATAFLAYAKEAFAQAGVVLSHEVPE